MEELRNYAVEVNKVWAEKLGINPSKAITCVKPSGTVSQLVDTSSGIHTRHSPFYLRTVRADQKDPLAKLMKDQGFPCEPDVMMPNSNYVFTFPVKSPEDSVFRDDRNAIEQLTLWLTYQRHWCEHKPSITVNVKEHEWMRVGAWVYDHFDEISGIAFLPHDGGHYAQAPYQEIDEETYEEWVDRMPVGYDWSKLNEYESHDTTKGTQEYACTGGVCEIVDIVEEG